MAALKKEIYDEIKEFESILFMKGRHRSFEVSSFFQDRISVTSLDHLSKEAINKTKTTKMKSYYVWNNNTAMETYHIFSFGGLLFCVERDSPETNKKLLALDIFFTVFMPPTEFQGSCSKCNNSLESFPEFMAHTQYVMKLHYH